MFCRQCEQTFRWQGCETMGVCGKTPEVADLQDDLIYAAQGIAVYANGLREAGWRNSTVDYFFMEVVFATLTNVNFDASKIEQMIGQALQVKDELTVLAKEKGLSAQAEQSKAATWHPDATNRRALLKESRMLGVKDLAPENEDINSIKEILLYGLKGIAAYAHHAFRLGEQDEEVTSFLYRGTAALTRENLSLDEGVQLLMDAGKANLKCLEILDRGHRNVLGKPEPTTVKVGWKKGPAIIVSGHDMYDLKDLLEQTQGKGVRVYTHGEMLPAHSYPELRKFEHLEGHFGTAWQNQREEFMDTPAAILMTTNCLQEPDASYFDQIFTTGAVGWPGVKHIPETGKQKDYRELIRTAIELGGFEDEKEEAELTIGFGHDTVLSHAEKIVGAVKEGNIKHFFLIGGCDGARPGRDYFSDMAQAIPDDCLILTLGCGKNRINRLEYPTVAGFPKLLDCGQCNDAYSAVVIAQALAKAFDCGVNDLPLSLLVSWYEQKAVAVLLTLLYLGIKNIRLGPSLPAFVSPNVRQFLVENFDLKPVGTVQEDLDAILSSPVA